MVVLDSVFLFLAGWLGWRFLERIGLPVASLFGGMLAVGILSLLGMEFHLPLWWAWVFQVILGILIGQRLKKGIGKELKSLWGPAVLVSVWMLISCFLVGYLFFNLTVTTPLTAILGTAPGGMTEFTLLAIEMGADPLVVVALQMMRVLVVMFFIPGLAIYKAGGIKAGSEKSAVRSGWQKGVFVTLAVGVSGGVLGKLLHLPVPGLLGAAFLVGFVGSVICELPPLPDDLRVFSQIGIGGLVGLNFTQETLRGLLKMGLPLIIATVLVMISSLVLAWVLRKMTAWDELTCLLAAAPGGVAQFFILAYELGADSLVVSLLQLARFLSLLIIIPFLLTWLGI
ncbi:MAG TPA: AbrB family transcriptional regulator [Clostridia bacterium]|jgi:membrane AbrB-like protein|nr:AbrB family transcriptional regulator [Clostridia bacterium]